MSKLVSVVLACALVLAGCGDSDETDGPEPVETMVKEQDEQTKKTQEELANRVDIVIKDGRATPQGKRVEVKVGEKVTLHVTSDADEELHVHSEPEHTFQVASGDDKTFDFTVKTPGQVAVEAHELGVTIVQLVVRP